MLRTSVGVLLAASVTHGIDNGIGITPPMGWRSWNQFDCGINQSLIEAQYEAMVSRVRTVNGVPTSLLDVGYHTAGIDDCWQQCNSGPGEIGFHNASGYPNVNKDKFPDMRAMASKARGLGLKPGWYGNNCACHETRDACKYDPNSGHDSECFVGDVQATIDFGFESIKLDGCGDQKNITHYAELFNATGHHVMLENCHNGNPTYPSRDPVTGVVDCPMNFFRSSDDIRPTYSSMLRNLQTTRQYNENNLTGPGCWAYPDMLEVGVTASQREAEGCVDGVPSDGCTLDVSEARTHFNAWCIVSAPLVLGFDLTDDTAMNAAWPIITNTEAIAVNQRWAGDSGTLYSESNTSLHMHNCSWGNKDCDNPAWQIWQKQLLPSRVHKHSHTKSRAIYNDALGDDAFAAFLFINNGIDTMDSLAVKWSQAGIACPATGCMVRDLDTHKDLGRYASGFSVKHLPSHASQFILVSI